MDWKHPSIVAIKGQPYTRKTSLARDLVDGIRFCFLIELEEIMDAISLDSPPTTEAAEQQITDQAYDIVCGLVATQLSLGISVFIDFLPPSGRPLLDKLVSLAAGTKLVVVDLRVEMEEAWRERLETAIVDVKWYKLMAVTNSSAVVDNCLDKPVQPGVSTLVVNVDDVVHGHKVAHVIRSLIFSQGDNHVDYDNRIQADQYNCSMMSCTTLTTKVNYV